MQQAKVFFFVAAGILMLAGAFHLGARTAQGQTGNTVAGVSALEAGGGLYLLAVTASNGDVWLWGGVRPSVVQGSQFEGNVFSGAPVQATETTWGRIKAERR